MSTSDQMIDLNGSATDPEPRVTLELGLNEADALRTWLLKASADGATSLDDPLVNGVLAKLGRAVDAMQAVLNIRRELQEAGLEVAHLSDDQVRDLGRRVSEAALPGIRG